MYATASNGAARDKRQKVFLCSFDRVNDARTVAALGESPMFTFSKTTQHNAAASEIFANIGGGKKISLNLSSNVLKNVSNAGSVSLAGGRFISHRRKTVMKEQVETVLDQEELELIDLGDAAVETRSPYPVPMYTDSIVGWGDWGLA
jgi:hypothetical protein